jgi:hypothetical protein
MPQPAGIGRIGAGQGRQRGLELAEKADMGLGFFRIGELAIITVSKSKQISIAFRAS